MGWLENTIEYQMWGMNAVTIGFMGTCILTVVECAFAWPQIRRIWREESADALAPVMFIYSAGANLSSFIYGLSIGSLALIVGGMLVLTFIPIVYGIAKFSGLRPQHWVLITLIIAALTLMAATDYKAQFFLFGSTGAVASILSQPWKMFRLKRVGVLQIPLVWVYAIGTSFWLVYALAVRDVPLMILTPCYLAGFTWIILLYYRYRYN